MNREFNKRNIYDDNIQDIRSINDLEQLDAFYNINILENKSDQISFEYGNDFWKYDKENNILYQFNDFVSLRENRGEDVTNLDYGKLIKEEINENKQLDSLPQFNLMERQDFVIEKGKVVNGAFKITPEKLKKKKDQAKDVSNQALDRYETEEMKSIVQFLKSGINMLALGYIAGKDFLDKRNKEKFVKGIIEGLDENKLDINKILEDRDIFEKLPELKDVIKRYQNQNITQESLSKQASTLLEDNEINSLAKDISNNEDFINGIFNDFEKEFSNQISLDDIDIFKNLFKESGKENSFEFTKDFIEKNIDDFSIKNGKANKNIDANELGLSMIFIANKIAPNKVDQKLLVEKISDLKIDKQNLGNIKTKNIADFVKIIFDKVKDLNNDLSNSQKLS